MTAAALVSLYRSTNRGDKYGDTRGRPHPHRGLDLYAKARGPLVFLRSGKVVLIDFSPVLGWYVVVQVGPRDFDGYCHLYGINVREQWDVTEGQLFAYAAGVNDPHGSAWKGCHLHLTNGPYIYSVYEGSTRNPEPIVNAVLLRIAGEVLTPIEEEEEEDIAMKRYVRDEPNKPYTDHDYFVEPGVAVTHSGSSQQTKDMCYRHFNGQPDITLVKRVALNDVDFAAMLKETGFPADAINVAAGQTYVIPRSGGPVTVQGGFGDSDRQLLKDTKTIVDKIDAGN